MVIQAHGRLLVVYSSTAGHQSRRGHQGYRLLLLLLLSTLVFA
jgi:hypothetical protein